MSGPMFAVAPPDPGFLDERSLARARRRRRAVRVGVVGAVIVGVVAAVVGAGLVVDAAAPGPDEVVQEYLEAIAAGDASTANALAPPPTSVYDALLGDDALRTADERIAGITVQPTAITPGADSVEVQGTYTLGGALYPFVIGVDRVGLFGSDRTFGSRWRIGTPLIATVGLDAAAGATLTVGSATVTALRASVSLPLYPARYTISESGTDLVGVAPVQVDAGAAGELRVARGAETATPALVAALEAAVEERIVFCETVVDPATPACPFAAPVTSRVIWLVPASPEVTVTSLPTADGAPGRVSISNATAEYSTDGTTSTPVPMQAEWTFTIVGDRVALTPF